MNQVTTIVAQDDESLFALQQRQAKIYAISILVPDHMRGGNENVAFANCYIALKLAEVMGEVPIIVMQHIHFIHGKAGFSAQYMIARANKSGVFDGRINWRIEGAGENLSVTAFATLADTGEEVSFTASMAMAKAEGWTSNKKYVSMPELMLRYRSATFLVRLYAPDVMLGYQTAEEITDVFAANPIDLDQSPRLTTAMLDEQAGVVINVEPVSTPASDVETTQPATVPEPEKKDDLDRAIDASREASRETLFKGPDTSHDKLLELVAMAVKAKTASALAVAADMFGVHKKAFDDEQVRRIESALIDASKRVGKA